MAYNQKFCIFVSKAQNEQRILLAVWLALCVRMHFESANFASSQKKAGQWLFVCTSWKNVVCSMMNLILAPEISRVTISSFYFLTQNFGLETQDLILKARFCSRKFILRIKSQVLRIKMGVTVNFLFKMFTRPHQLLPNMII